MFSSEVYRAEPPSRLYNFSFELPFESTFDAVHWTHWFHRNWAHALWLSTLYVLLIHAGRAYMATRPPFDLRGPLAYWNWLTAAFSLLGAIRMTPEFVHVLANYGFHHSVCTAGYTQLKVTGFWATVFTLSKAVELVDTGFIVLRKRPLIFLHWYHHVTVMLLTWYGYKDHTAPARWFIWMNYNVHALMYAYYGARALGWPSPKWIAATVTSLQITQMLVGCYIAFHIYMTKATGHFCQQTEPHLRFTILVYLSYLLLFLHFFYKAYLKPSPKKKAP
jgi:elongation of very long chain fatty acids protein 6